MKGKKGNKENREEKLRSQFQKSGKNSSFLISQSFFQLIFSLKKSKSLSFSSSFSYKIGFSKLFHSAFLIFSSQISLRAPLEPFLQISSWPKKSLISLWNFIKKQKRNDKLRSLQKKSRLKSLIPPLLLILHTPLTYNSLQKMEYWRGLFIKRELKHKNSHWLVLIGQVWKKFASWSTWTRKNQLWVQICRNSHEKLIILNSSHFSHVSISKHTFISFQNSFILKNLSLSRLSFSLLAYWG